jgi:hypothetical protein
MVIIKQMNIHFNTNVYHFTEDVIKLLLDKFKGKVVGSDVMTKEIVMNELFGDFKHGQNVEPPAEEPEVDQKKHKIHILSLLRYKIREKLFLRLEKCIMENINEEIIHSLKTSKGNTQEKERISISSIKTCLDKINYSYEEASSQQSKDFRNINKIGLNIEIKKTDTTTVYFNDTLPSLDIFYIIIFTGKKFKTKGNIPPKIIFINGYDLCKPDIYHLMEYKKDIEKFKDKWGRKGSGGNANRFKYFSVYPRPTYKTRISHLLDSKYSHNLIN